MKNVSLAPDSRPKGPSPLPFNLRRCCCRFHATQLDNPAAKWLLSEGFSVVYSDVEGELVVGGVFLRLFVANPGWVLRKPKEFITELLEKWSEIVSIANPNVRHLT